MFSSVVKMNDDDKDDTLGSAVRENKESDAFALIFLSFDSL